MPTFERVLVAGVTIALIASGLSAQSRNSHSLSSASSLLTEQFREGFHRSIEPVLPAVVTIQVLRGPRDIRREVQQPETGTEFPPGEDPIHQHDGTGSGIIFDKRGYVMTCHHVVESADTVLVRLSDGRTLEAAQLLFDPVTDIAVIKVTSDEPLPAAPLGNSDDLRIGDWVASIGNPYELGLSVSAGIVSATDRHLATSPRTHLIQTDAASNPGNSGGALVNVQGEVVGISEGGYGINEGFQGIGLAIPITDALRTATRLIENGEVIHIKLDFDTQPMEPELANFFGVNHDQGLLVCDVARESAAAKAGIQVGDILTAISGQAVHSNCDVITAIELANPADPLRMSLLRKGAIVTVEVNPDPLENINHHLSLSNNDHQTKMPYGIVVGGRSASEMQRLGFKSQSDGVVVTHVSPRSYAAKEGVCAGMAILRVGETPVENINDYQKAMKKLQRDHQILALFATPNQQHFVLLQRSSGH